jgi:lysophospholipase L1-like esterase
MVVGAAAPVSAARQSAWVGTWAAAQMLVDAKDAVPPALSSDVTVRQLFRTSVGGSRLRVHVSNAFGREPLTITDAAIARAVAPGSSRILAATSRPVTFHGERVVTIPAGAEFLSDPIAMPAAPLTTYAVSIHCLTLPKLETGHPGSRATSYFVARDRVAAADLASAAAVDHWYFLGGIDVERPGTSAVAVLGDSITDGHGVAANTDTRWTDFLAERLSGSRATAVLNLGIGGNRLLEDGLGPNALARFDRDVLARDGVRYLIILEGVNDLGVLTRDAPVPPERHRALVQHMIAAYAQMIARAHDRGIKVIGATIMPDGASGYYHADASNEADRAAVNAWIRKPGNFDGVIDFDSLMRDPAHPVRLRKQFDSGDGLHPSPAGYQLMGRAVPLTLFSGVRS